MALGFTWGVHLSRASVRFVHRFLALGGYTKSVITFYPCLFAVRSSHVFFPLICRFVISCRICHREPTTIYCVHAPDIHMFFCHKVWCLYICLGSRYAWVYVQQYETGSETQFVASVEGPLICRFVVSHYTVNQWESPTVDFYRMYFLPGVFL